MTAPGRALRSGLRLALPAALLANALSAGDPATPVEAARDAARAVDAGREAALCRFEALGLDGLLPGAQGPRPGDLDAARRLLEAARTAAAPDAGIGATTPPPVGGADRKRYFVFASEALGPGALAAIDALAAARGDMEVAFRGLAPGDTLDGFATRRRRGDAAAPATIDPRPFRDHGVDRAPALLDRATGRLVWGVADPDALEGREGGEVLGSLVAISEVDLAELMRARALEVDWGARMRRAADSWVARLDPGPLLPARAPRIRRIDARVRLAADFTLPDGRLVAPAGAMLDPTAIMPLTLTLVVFDARDEGEVALVETLLPGIAEPVLIASAIDPLEGWAAFERLGRRFGMPVHLLQRDLRARFALERTVSVVTGGPGWFEVREIPRPTAQGGPR